LLKRSVVASTFAVVKDVLQNPVYNALLSGDANLCLGTGTVKYFDEQVSPFVGFHEDYDKGFDDLHQQLPVGRNILYATTQLIEEPNGWLVLAEIKGLQFVFAEKKTPAYSIEPVPLDNHHVEEMVALAKLTKPGPFGLRTIEFGHYHGIFENGQLAAMTGQRLHVDNYTEISAVCTHPDHLGKGYAASLILHQANFILSQGQHPFLHVRGDNERAIALYKRLGFEVSREMNFYFMKRRDKK
jgi:ribosomal protein S18 acetylase RimI-like enzyme